jgi:hypothetical protein
MKRETQTSKLLKLLSDGYEHSTQEIQLVCYGADHLGTARIASRVDDLRRKGHEIPRARLDKDDPTMAWYRMVLKPRVVVDYVPVEVGGVRMMRRIERTVAPNTQILYEKHT